MTPEQALNELPPTYQAIGRIAQRLKRVKRDSPRGKELWEAYDRLNREGAELSRLIREAITR